MSDFTTGLRINIRGEDFLVVDSKNEIVEAIGITELVKGKRFEFNMELEEYDIIAPENTTLQPDTSPNYRQTKLFIETTLRNSSHYSDAIEIANKAAIFGADYQYLPTIKALQQPKPRILIADAVGLGKTVQVGIFMAELMRRGKGDRVLVVTPKSILAQFQQEIWSRFAIPLVRLDSQGIARIKADIPANKNPFDYYDKVIVSIDTLKNNGKFRHYLEKTFWDIVAIDECHNVANASSQRGNLAKFLSQRCEAMVLTSATPHNGKKENFATLIKLLDPTAVPYDGNFTSKGIEPLYVRRFKKDVEIQVANAFKERVTTSLTCQLHASEESVLEIIQQFKKEAYEAAEGNLNAGVLLFSIGLFKAYMSSPKACLETINRRLAKANEGGVLEVLTGLKERLEAILAKQEDAKYQRLKEHLQTDKWKGKAADKRIILFSERRDTLDYLEERLRADFKLGADTIVQFTGSLTDEQQRIMLEDFQKADSPVRVFLASDAGSQGVNLHYQCHIMFNYDIPWSIITLDQRNGRIDRFGQEETPYIYYLVAQSQNNQVQGDIRILERLKEKEEEVHKSLGDPMSVHKLYGEDSITKQIAEGAAIEEKTDDFAAAFDMSNPDAWMAMVNTGGEEGSSSEKYRVRFDSSFESFYQDDFTYYDTLREEITYKEDGLKNSFIIDQEAKTMELATNEELSRYGVLYDLPREAFPAKNDTFKLTTNKALVEDAIKKARKRKAKKKKSKAGSETDSFEKNQWAKFQLLYDLHPIARWMQFKLLAKVDRGKALVCRLQQPLPPQSAWYVFQGISSNGQGKPILSKSFVIGRSFIGQSVGNRESFAEFANDYQLKDRYPTLEISKEELSQIEQLLPAAVNAAKKLYQLKLQGDLEDDIEEKLTKYSLNLNQWVQESEKQLTLQYGEEDKGLVGRHKDKRKKEVEYVREQMDKFYRDYYHLENEPFIRLLAVFYHA
jgi:SNF2 family DNA or RNA helicase